MGEPFESKCINCGQISIVQFPAPRAPLDVLMGVWTCASPTQPDATVVAYTRPILLRATQDRRTSVVISGYQWDFAALEEPTP